MHVSASFQELEDEKELSEESGDEELQLEEFPLLKTLDPKDWKVHVAVLFAYSFHDRCLCLSSRLQNKMIFFHSVYGLFINIPPTRQEDVRCVNCKMC